MRSFLGLISAMWFAGQTWLIGDGSTGLVGDAPNQTVLGDPAAIAIHSVARVLFVGCAILSLALVDWTPIAAWFGNLVDDASVAPGP